MPLSRRPVVLSLFAAALLAVACGDDGSVGSPTATTTTQTSITTQTSTTTQTTTSTTTTIALDTRAARPYSVSTAQFTFVDDTRATPESADGPATEERTIEVWLHLPEADAPVPLIVFAHGMAGHPRKFEELHTAWAAAGYAVAAPAFPLSNDGATGAFTNSFDVPNQPGDVSFVLDELLARSADESSELAGRFDPERVAASGLSAGGFTTYEAAVNDLARDRRFRAAIVMAGAFRETSDFVGADDVPVLVMQGDADPLISVATAEAAYESLQSPRYLVVLLGGGHAGPFEDGDDAFEPKVDGHDELIAASTIAFWDRHLLGVDAAEGELLAAIDQDGLTTFEVDLG